MERPQTTMVVCGLSDDTHRNVIEIDCWMDIVQPYNHPTMHAFHPSIHPYILNYISGCVETVSDVSYTSIQTSVPNDSCNRVPSSAHAKGRNIETHGLRPEENRVILSIFLFVRGYVHVLDMGMYVYSINVHSIIDRQEQARNRADRLNGEETSSRMIHVWS